MNVNNIEIRTLPLLKTQNTSNLFMYHYQDGINTAKKSTLGRVAFPATGILEPLIFSLFQANLVKKCYVIDVKIRQDMCTSIL